MKLYEVTAALHDRAGNGVRRDISCRLRWLFAPALWRDTLQIKLSCERGAKDAVCSAHAGREPSLRVIVIGAGKLGYQIARLLSEEDHDIVVIDNDPDALSEVANHLDVLAIEGNGASPAVLAKAEVGKTDLLIAAAGPDEVNMIACLAAKRLGVSMCAARVRTPDYIVDEPELSYRRLGIDVLIDTERTAATEIARILKTPNATQVDYFANGRVSVIRVRVDEGAPVTRAPLREIRPERCVIAAVVRDDDLFIPDGDTVIEPDDRIYVVTHTGQFAAIRELTGVADRRPLREVTIVGGGRVGFTLAQLLLKSRRRAPEVKIIERDYDRCTELAGLLDHALIICGDGEKFEVLEEEMVGRADAFVAVTSEDGTNLLSTLAAKELGAGEAIARLSREDYIPLAERAGADAIVVPRLITASTLLKLVRQHPIVSLALLEDGRAEAVEIVVEEGVPATGKTLAELKKLDGAIVGAIVRHDKVIVPKGDTEIAAGDRLVLFGMASALPKAQQLFRQ